MKNIPAKEIMTSPVITVKEDEVLSKFIDLMLKNGINGLPVVDDNGRLAGIATRTDLLAFELKRELNTLYEKKLHNIFKEYMSSKEWSSFNDMVLQFNRTITVRDIIVRNVITAELETPVKDICRTMKNKKINHVVIMDDNNIAGIITSRDIIGLVAGEE